MDVAHGSGLAHAPLAVAPAVGALSLAVAGGGGRPCAHAETWFCLQFLDLVDVPLNVHRQVCSLCVDVVDSLSWRSGRFLWSVPDILLLQYTDKVVVLLYVLSCWRQSSSHSCSLDKVVDMPVVFNDSPWFNVQKTALVPQLLRVFLVADVPVVQVVLVPLSAAMDAL